MDDGQGTPGQGASCGPAYPKADLDSYPHIDAHIRAREHTNTDANRGIEPDAEAESNAHTEPYGNAYHSHGDA